jgi:hypothetical protein
VNSLKRDIILGDILGEALRLCKGALDEKEPYSGLKFRHDMGWLLKYYLGRVN